MNMWTPGGDPQMTRIEVEQVRDEIRSTLAVLDRLIADRSVHNPSSSHPGTVAGHG